MHHTAAASRAPGTARRGAATPKPQTSLHFVQAEEQVCHAK